MGDPENVELQSVKHREDLDTTQRGNNDHSGTNDVAFKEKADKLSMEGHQNKSPLQNNAKKPAKVKMVEVYLTEGESPPEYHRGHWGKNIDFLLSMIGYAVDLANVWRFPYLCYRNGGGAYLIPYFSCLLLGALPLFYMELVLGQFHREGAITVWKIVPIFKGAGMAVCWMSYLVAFYYNVVIGWSFYYLFASFTSVLPWTTCRNEWNSVNCWREDWSENFTNFNNRTYNENSSVSSVNEFFERGVLLLHKSEGLHNIGPVNWKLALCTLAAFVFLYFGLWKGVKSSGKVVWVTATAPYLILTILLIRGLMLPGSGDGVKYFITPRLDKLSSAQAWIDAAVQIFFSIGAGFGVHVAFASYNKFNNNCYRDCLITAGVNSFTSIFSGFVIFSYLGYMAHKSERDISEVATEGPGLTFEVYPEAVATIPGSVAWSIIFFIMMLMLGIDSAMGGLESVLTGVHDAFKDKFTRIKYSRELFTLLVVSTSFLFTLPCNTQGGMYVFKILDTYIAGSALLFAVVCQAIAVGWFYGVDQFSEDIHSMLGFRPGIYWRLCWKFFSPGLLLLIVVVSFVEHVPLNYHSQTWGTYIYPEYANAIGWMFAISSMSLVPGYAIYLLLTTKGSLSERVAICISPVWEHEEIRQKKQVKRFQKSHWLSI